MAINFVKEDEMRALEELENFFSTEIQEMPANIGDLL